MLEHPILSPVDESEFVLFGKKEFDRIRRGIRAESFSSGVLAGVFFAAIIIALAKMWAVVLW